MFITWVKYCLSIQSSAFYSVKIYASVDNHSVLATTITSVRRGRNHASCCKVLAKHKKMNVWSMWSFILDEYRKWVPQEPNHECIRFKKWARTITEGNTPKFSKKLKIPEHFRAQCVFSYSRFSVRWKKAPNYLKIGTENFIYLALMLCHFWWEGLYLTLLTPVALT